MFDRQEEDIYVAYYKSGIRIEYTFDVTCNLNDYPEIYKLTHDIKTGFSRVIYLKDVSKVEEDIKEVLKVKELHINYISISKEEELKQDNKCDYTIRVDISIAKSTRKKLDIAMDRIDTPYWHDRLIEREYKKLLELKNNIEFPVVKLVVNFTKTKITSVNHKETRYWFFRDY